MPQLAFRFVLLTNRVFCSPARSEKGSQRLGFVCVWTYLSAFSYGRCSFWQVPIRDWHWPGCLTWLCMGKVGLQQPSLWATGERCLNKLKWSPKKKQGFIDWPAHFVGDLGLNWVLGKGKFVAWQGSIFFFSGKVFKKGLQFTSNFELCLALWYLHSKSSILILFFIINKSISVLRLQYKNLVTNYVFL